MSEGKDSRHGPRVGELGPEIFVPALTPDGELTAAERRRETMLRLAFHMVPCPSPLSAYFEAAQAVEEFITSGVVPGCRRPPPPFREPQDGS